MKIVKIVYYILDAVVVLIALLFIVSTFPIAGNYKVLTVVSGSMEPSIKIGSVVAVMPKSDYKIGDIITFLHGPKTEPPITHRIYDIKVVGGQPVYITKGDANKSPDIDGTAKKDIEGKVLFSVPYLGYLVNFIKNPLGFILIIVAPAGIVIYEEIRKIYKEIKKKKKPESEQNDN